MLSLIAGCLGFDFATFQLCEKHGTATTANFYESHGHVPRRRC